MIEAKLGRAGDFARTIGWRERYSRLLVSANVPAFVGVKANLTARDCP